MYIGHTTNGEIEEEDIVVYCAARDLCAEAYAIGALCGVLFDYSELGQLVRDFATMHSWGIVGDYGPLAAPCVVDDAAHGIIER